MIREMVDTDIEQAIRIWKDAMPRAHEEIPLEHWDNSLPNFRNELKNAKERYVYEEDNEIVGFVAMGSENNYIFELCVMYSKQDKGIGNELIDTLKSRHNSLTLRVYECNSKVCVYRKLGFEISEDPSPLERKYPKLYMKWCK